MCETKSEPEVAVKCNLDSQRHQPESATMSDPETTNNCEVEAVDETVSKCEPEPGTTCQLETTTVGEPDPAINPKTPTSPTGDATVHQSEAFSKLDASTASETGATSKSEQEEIATNCKAEGAETNETEAAIKCEPWVRDFITDLSEPVVFQGMIDDWDMIRWEVEDWTAVFDDEDLPVRSATSSCSAFPLWEGQCEAESMTIEELADLDPATPGEEKKWYYFDYKYLREWVPEGNEALKTMTWAKFGYPEYEVNDTTLWIGSKGAHTPLHYDTYGCNLVAQIHGTKRWILFPPKSQNMRPTRVPYEESSVYSMWNLNCPLPSEFYTDDRDVVIVDLKPGQVLLVPQHWWHFVESLDTTISVNVWLPVRSDDKFRLEESLVRLMMHRLCTGLSDEDRSDLLNPTEHSVGNGKTYMFQSLNVISGVIENCLESQEEEEKEAQKQSVEEPPSKKVKLVEENVSDTSSRLKTLNGVVLPHSSLDQLKKVMDLKCHCSSHEEHVALIKRETEEKEEKYSTKIEKIINSFLHPDIMAQVLKKFGESHNIK